eukprot:s1033_g3.t1
MNFLPLCPKNEGQVDKTGRLGYARDFRLIFDCMGSARRCSTASCFSWTGEPPVRPTRGCRHGNDCSYCHLDHVHRVVDRRFRKRTRDKITASLQNPLRLPVDLAEIQDTWRILMLHALGGAVSRHSELDAQIALEHRAAFVGHFLHWCQDTRTSQLAIMDNLVVRKSTEIRPHVASWNPSECCNLRDPCSASLQRKVRTLSDAYGMSGSS